MEDTKKLKKNDKNYIKQYMQQYAKAHPEKWLTKKKCDICGGRYQLGTSTRHKKCRKHVMVLMEKEIEILKDTIKNLEDKLKQQ